MRRLNPVSVKVRAPSRGLVTRFPGETADQLATGTDKFSLPGIASRTATVASNVRYDDGVVRNAPGYDRILLIASILVDLVAHWRLDEVQGTRFDATLNHHDLSEQVGDVPDLDRVLQVAGLFANAARFPANLTLDGAAIFVVGNDTHSEPGDALTFPLFSTEGAFIIYNTGSVPLIVTNVAAVDTDFVPDYTSGTIPVGGFQTVNVEYVGGLTNPNSTITVTSNATQGRDTLDISANFAS